MTPSCCRKPPTAQRRARPHVDGEGGIRTTPRCCKHGTYILSHIVHDWDEAKCLQILGHVKAAKRPDAKVLIVETMVPPPNVMHPGKVLDIHDAHDRRRPGAHRTKEEYGARLLVTASSP